MQETGTIGTDGGSLIEGSGRQKENGEQILERGLMEYWAERGNFNAFNLLAVNCNY